MFRKPGRDASPTKIPSTRYRTGQHIAPAPSSANLSVCLTGGLRDLYYRIGRGESLEDEDTGLHTNKHGQFQPGHDGPVVMAGRYNLTKLLNTRGQSAVLAYAEDMFQQNQSVVIKILHASYYEVGIHEAKCLKRLSLADPLCVSHTVKLLHMERIRKLTVRLLVVLGFLRHQNTIHADIKPDNILLKHENDLHSVRVIDFGNSIQHVHQEMSLYYKDFDVQTLLYRAPEVIYGLPFGAEIDMWSLGCVLAELYLGRPLLFGKTKSEMVSAMTSILGPLPKYPYQRGKFYSEMMSYTDSTEQEDATLKLMASLDGCIDFSFANFLAQLFRYNPDERLCPFEAAQHPFLAQELCISFLLPPTKKVQQPTILLNSTTYKNNVNISSEVRRQNPSSYDLLAIGTSERNSSSPVSSCKQESDLIQCKENCTRSWTSWTEGYNRLSTRTQASKLVDRISDVCREELRFIKSEPLENVDTAPGRRGRQSPRKGVLGNKSSVKEKTLNVGRKGGQQNVTVIYQDTDMNEKFTKDDATPVKESENRADSIFSPVSKSSARDRMYKFSPDDSKRQASKCPKVQFSSQTTAFEVTESGHSTPNRVERSRTSVTNAQNRLERSGRTVNSLVKNTQMRLERCRPCSPTEYRQEQMERSGRSQHSSTENQLERFGPILGSPTENRANRMKRSGRLQDSPIVNTANRVERPDRIQDSSIENTANRLERSGRIQDSSIENTANRVERSGHIQDSSIENTANRVERRGLQLGSPNENRANREERSGRIQDSSIENTANRVERRGLQLGSPNENRANREERSGHIQDSSIENTANRVERLGLQLGSPKNKVNREDRSGHTQDPSIENTANRLERHGGLLLGSPNKNRVNREDRSGHTQDPSIENTANRLERHGGLLLGSPNKNRVNREEKSGRTQQSSIENTANRVGRRGLQLGSSNENRVERSGRTQDSLVANTPNRSNRLGSILISPADIRRNRLERSSQTSSSSETSKKSVSRMGSPNENRLVSCRDPTWKDTDEHRRGKQRHQTTVKTNSESESCEGFSMRARGSAVPQTQKPPCESQKITDSAGGLPKISKKLGHPKQDQRRDLILSPNRTRPEPRAQELDHKFLPEDKQMVSSCDSESEGWTEEDASQIMMETTVECGAPTIDGMTDRFEDATQRLKFKRFSHLNQKQSNRAQQNVSRLRKCVDPEVSLEVHYKRANKISNPDVQIQASLNIGKTEDERSASGRRASFDDFRKCYLPSKAPQNINTHDACRRKGKKMSTPPVMKNGPDANDTRQRKVRRLSISNYVTSEDDSQSWNVKTSRNYENTEALENPDSESYESEGQSSPFIPYQDIEFENLEQKYPEPKFKLDQNSSDIARKEKCKNVSHNLNAFVTSPARKPSTKKLKSCPSDRKVKTPVSFRPGFRKRKASHVQMDETSFNSKRKSWVRGRDENWSYKRDSEPAESGEVCGDHLSADEEDSDDTVLSHACTRKKLKPGHALSDTAMRSNLSAKHAGYSSEEDSSQYAGTRTVAAAEETTLFDESVVLVPEKPVMHHSTQGQGHRKVRGHDGFRRKKWQDGDDDEILLLKM